MRNKLKKIIFTNIFFFIVLTSSFALELGTYLHFDTYSEDFSVGISFFAKENIFKNLILEANLDYFTANAYEAMCSIKSSYKFLDFGGGLAYSIDNSQNNIMVPGINFFANMRLPFNLGLFGSAILSLAPANLYQAYSFRTLFKLSFSTPNANSFINYSIKQSAEFEGKNHGILFQVEAFEKGIPFTLILGFEANILALEETNFEFNIKAGTSINTKKWGSYKLEGKFAPISYREVSFPFCITCGTKLTF